MYADVAHSEHLPFEHHTYYTTHARFGRFSFDINMLRTMHSTSMSTNFVAWIALAFTYQMHISCACGDLAFFVCVCVRVFHFFVLLPHECSVVVFVCPRWSEKLLQTASFFVVENLELTISQHKSIHDTIILAHNLYALQFSLKSKIID